MPPADSMTCTLDFALDGKQFGDIELLFSDNKHAFSKIPIPIVCIKNGSGPTLLLTAGNHGDEYEGQVILRRLIHATSPQEINGRLIILPALNYPAVLDDARVSPLDGGNLNRSFPGDAAAGPTAAIAEYVTEHLLPLCDAGIDLHSGGSNAWYLPSAFLCTAADPAMTRANLALAEAFAAPYTLVVRGAGAPTGFDPVANARGVPFISCELGGDGVVNVGVVVDDLEYFGIRHGRVPLRRVTDVKHQRLEQHLLRAFDGCLVNRVATCVKRTDIAGSSRPYNGSSKCISANTPDKILYGTFH